MFLELIAIFVAGFGAAGIVLLLNRLTRGALPKWTTPVVAGGTMIAVAVVMEYSWGGRTIENLPEGVEVVETVQESALYKPWTYLRPATTRIMAADVGTMQTNPDAPDVRLVDIYLFGRWQPLQSVPQLVRCDPPARAVVSDAALADPETAAWTALDPDAELIRVTCADPEEE